MFREVIYKLFHDSAFREALRTDPQGALKAHGYSLSTDEYEATMGLLQNLGHTIHKVGPFPNEIGWFVPIELTPVEG